MMKLRLALLVVMSTTAFADDGPKVSRDGTTVGLPLLTCRLDGCTPSIDLCSVATGECTRYDMPDGITRTRDLGPVKLTPLQRIRPARTQAEEHGDFEQGVRVVASRVRANVGGIIITVTGQLPARVHASIPKRRATRRTFDCGGERRAAVTHAFAIGTVVYVELQCVNGIQWERIAT